MQLDVFQCTSVPGTVVQCSWRCSTIGEVTAGLLWVLFTLCILSWGPFYPSTRPALYICIVCRADHSHAFIPVHRHQSIIIHWTTTIYVQFVSKVNLNKVVLALQNDGTTIPQKKLSSDFQSFRSQSIWQG